MNAIAPLFLTLLLSACTAIQKSEPEVKRARKRIFGIGNAMTSG